MTLLESARTPYRFALHQNAFDLATAFIGRLPGLERNPRFHRLKAHLIVAQVDGGKPDRIRDRQIVDSNDRKIAWNRKTPLRDLVEQTARDYIVYAQNARYSQFQ